jgi:hypothetical protein
MKGNVLSNSIRPSEKEGLSVRVRKKGEVTSLVTVFNLKGWLSDRQCSYLLSYSQKVVFQSLTVASKVNSKGHVDFVILSMSSH